MTSTNTKPWRMDVPLTLLMIALPRLWPSPREEEEAVLALEWGDVRSYCGGGGGGGGDAGMLRRWYSRKKDVLRAVEELARALLRAPVFGNVLLWRGVGADAEFYSLEHGWRPAV